jgi:hypothetical protein
MVGVGANLALRAALVVMVAEVLRAGPDDPRFAGKGIATRFVAVGLPATLLVPALWLWRRHRRAARGLPPPPYPAWVDALYVSLFALDLAGNVFDLYDRYTHFDLIPHAHGGGTIAVLAAWLLGLPMAKAIELAIVGHVLLEAQEYASDVAFGLHNVRGPGDVVGDLTSGVVGSVAYALIYERFVRDEGREPVSPLAV